MHLLVFLKTIKYNDLAGLEGCRQYARMSRKTVARSCDSIMSALCSNRIINYDLGCQSRSPVWICLLSVLDLGSEIIGRDSQFLNTCYVDQIVSSIVDPLLQAINESATRLSTTDMAVYLLNCIYQMQSTLSLYEFMDERLERLQVRVTTATIAQVISTWLDFSILNKCMCIVLHFISY